VRGPQKQALVPHRRPEWTPNGSEWTPNRPLIGKTARDGRQAIKELVSVAALSLPEIGHSAANIGRTAAEFARHSRAPATESAYASDWADFAAWCNSAERIALPAEPVTIGAYLSDRSGILKVSTLNRRLAAITAMHRLGGHGLDGKHPAIALVLAGIRRTYGTRQVAKRALLTEDLRRIGRRRILPHIRVDDQGGATRRGSARELLKCPNQRRVTPFRRAGHATGSSVSSAIRRADRPAFTSSGVRTATS
jgi:hypothetical protein